MTIYFHSSEEMPELGDNSIGAVITSPPYPMIQKWDPIWESSLSPFNNWQEQHNFLLQVWRECYRVLVPGGICCINIGDATRSHKEDGRGFRCWPNFAAIQIGCTAIGFVPLVPIFWRKISNKPNAFLGSGFQPPNAYVSQDCEYIAIFRKGSLRQFKGKDPIRYDSSYTKEERDKWFQQIWEVPGAKGSKETSSWPLEIPYRLMRMFTVKDDTILDPFCGSGEARFLFEQHSRSFVGYEVNQDAVQYEWDQIDL